MTMPRDPGTSSYGNGPPCPAGSAHPASIRYRLRFIVLVPALVVTLGAGVLAAILLPTGATGPAPLPPAPPPAAALPRAAAELAVPSAPNGTATLTDPTITVVKTALPDSRRWCSLLTGADIRAVTGFEQRGTPDSDLLCTHYLTADAGHLFVSDIPASAGAAFAVRGNSAIVYQSDPAACEVTIALNRGGGVLDVDLRGITRPRVPLCQAAAGLAMRAFDRLPAG